MRNIKLLIEYEGTNYAGWQIQPDLPTIQGIIQNRLKIILREDVKLVAASRTDAGVHALGQVANFKTIADKPPISIQRSLNALLPEDIVIKGVEEVDLEFDARRDARSKTYQYLILNRPYPSALYRNLSWFIPNPLNIEVMQEGAQYLVGERDFSSFRSADCSAINPVREILAVSARTTLPPLPFPQGVREGGFIEIEVKGTAFLMHMVRIMVGTLVSLGKGRITVEGFKAIIEARDRTKAGMTAPPRGLFLKEVEYERKTS
ncbi:MAG: tRNA pseudouridine(38-40) synthase TruA [Deltaproteobacteria bacterium]|nr:tRNA pseudouridine(38-40) synthase TruA [Deltaproteobacteria bacterium]